MSDRKDLGIGGLNEGGAEKAQEKRIVYSYTSESEQQSSSATMSKDAKSMFKNRNKTAEELEKEEREKMLEEVPLYSPPIHPENDASAGLGKRPRGESLLGKT